MSRHAGDAMTNRTEAESWLEQVTAALIEGTTDSITPVIVGVTVAHALLDVADAIREQTAYLGGIRDDLADVAHAARRPRE